MRYRSFHPRSRTGLLLAAVTLLTGVILAGCGGSASEKLQVVSGEGFQFQAPAGWKVGREAGAVTASNGVNLMQVRVLPLVKRYRPAEYAKVVGELDRTALSLARQPQLPGGRLVQKRNELIAGRKVRAYRIDFNPGKTEELAFVLRDKTEYLLLCRRSTDGSDANCQRLFTTFVFD
jgi:hypothetical protein